MSLMARLYRSDFHVNFVGRRKIWYAASGVLLAVCVASMIVRGFSLGIDFSGGAVFQLPARGHSVQEAKDTLSTAGVDPGDAVIQQLENTKQVRVQTPTLTDQQTDKVTRAFAERFGVKPNDIAVSTVGASWGSTITNKAIKGLVVFLVLVMVYLSIRFEWKMAAAAMAALLHDLVVTMGIYSLVGFEVTPSTVIGVLTILGFSLYDTVVVFDRVRENTAGMGTSSKRSYAEATNDALNQTLVRSLNTSLIALIPVASLLFVGAGLLGAGTLKDLALAQFVGIASGTYSSLFVATPLLVDLKKNEEAVRKLDERVARARAAAAREAARLAADADPAGDRAEDAAGESALDAAGREPAAAGARAAGARRAGGQPGGARRTSARRGGRRGRPSGKKRR
jgi:preprotein translocase subunit SecF